MKFIASLIFAVVALDRAAADEALNEVNARPSQIAYLAENRFDLQNNFLANFLSQLEERDSQFSYELVSFSDEKDIDSCLANGSCLASINYQAVPVG